MNRSSSMHLNTGKRRNRLRIDPRYVLIVFPISLVVLHQSVVVMHHSQQSASGDESANRIRYLGNEPVREKAPKKIKTASNTEEYQGPPTWISDYIVWHQEMRSQYPGLKLFTDPSAPKILIRMCLGLCGGLNDRLGQLPWDLYIANQTKRILLIRWERPKALEEFLVPNELDWTVPKGAEGFGDMHAVRRLYPDMFRNYSADRPEKDFWESHLDLALERAKFGEFKDNKVLRYQLLGHLDEAVLEKRLQDLGETDMIHYSPSFGKIFTTFFRPSRPVEATLNSVYQELGLTPKKYTAVHCRVRHPKAFPKNVYVKGKSAAHPADKTGLPWIGQTRDFAIAIATHALQCARTLLSDANEPIYFFSDSNDLVRYMSRELKDPGFVSANASIFEQNNVDKDALSVVKTTNIVARDTTIENAHIDRQKGRDPAAYYATFVDLFLAINSRCITYGVGYYAIFAAKISGTQCKLLYQEEAWGSSDNKKFKAKVCQLSSLPKLGTKLL